MTPASAPSLFGEGLRLLRPFWRIALFATMAGALSGLATAWLLATINTALHAEGGAGTAVLFAFAALCTVAVVGEVASDLGNSFVGQQVVASMRTELTDRILAAPIDQIERFRTHRLTATLNHDIEVISSFTFAFSSLAIALAVTLGGLAYLVALSPVMSLIAAAAIAAGSLVHARARKAGRAGFDAARGLQDELQQHYRAIAEGAKELRVNRDRRLRVRNIHLGKTIAGIRDLRVRAMRIYMTANALGSVLFFIVIGLLLALQARFSVSSETLSGFVLVLLYVKGPLQQLVGALPMIGQAQIAFRRIAALEQAFSGSEAGLLAEVAPARPTLRTIELAGASYTFATDDRTGAFTLGPIDLTISAGEIVFVVGENGCGKTTLIKLLLGLYVPDTGSIRLDGDLITPGNRDAYRQLFTTVFADYYLFDDVIPGDATAMDVARRLQQLDLAHKVTMRDGRFTTTDLSTGQRKRLALIHAYLENRPVVVFDEWAADQDPTFRRIFYAEMLPELRAQGKTLVVISHDDRYFDSADRLVRMADGRIVEIVDMRGKAMGEALRMPVTTAAEGTSDAAAIS